MQVRQIWEPSREFPGFPRRHWRPLPPGISFVAYQPCPFAAGRGVPFPKFASHQEGRGAVGAGRDDAA